MMDDKRIEKIRARCEAATPGPWRWWFNEHCQDIKLVTDHSGMYYVMGFARHGMQNAQPLFQRYERYEGPLGERGGRGMVKASNLGKWAQDYRHNDGWIDHPDAELIAHAPSDIAYLLSVITARDAQIAELEREEAEKALEEENE